MSNILIIKFGALGDVVRTSYILPGLCEKYDAPKIYWLTSPGSFDLLRFNPYILQVVTPGMNFSVLQKVNFDLVISLDDEREVLELLNALTYHDLIGAYLDGGVASYTPSAAEWFDMGLISKYGKIKADQLKKDNKREHNEIYAEMLGIEIKSPIFFNSPVTEHRIRTSIDGNYFNIGINSGAGARWTSKQLALSETIKLVRSLLPLQVANKPTRLYLLGGADEEDRHRTIMEAVKSDRLIDTGNDNSLLEFTAIIKCCDYLVSSDSLALHFAIAQGVRNLSFYAPTSAAEIGTFGTGTKVISSAADYCSYRKDADNSSITAERVLESMLLHLQESSITVQRQATHDPIQENLYRDKLR